MISVLFVDDNSDLLARVRSTLEKADDIRLETARSTRHAIEKLHQRQQAYDAIVSYERIPEVNGIEFVSDMNGIEFIRCLRAEGNPTPVILLSRRGQNTLSVGEVTVGTEITLPPSGDIRPQVAEIVTLIKQVMLRRRDAQEKKDQTEQLADILSATPLGIFQVRGGKISWVNPRIAAMLGYEEAKLAGRELRELVATDEEYEQLLRELQFRRDAAGFGLAECELLKKDGTALSCRLQARLPDPRDISRGGTVVVTDISEKKQAERALKESEAKYREVLRNTQSIILRMDPQGTITFFNAYALTFFDYTRDEVIGKNVVGTIVPAKARGGHGLAMMADDLGFNAEGYAINVNENVRRNGDRVWIAWINKAIRDEKGHIAEILCIGNDITDRKPGGEVRISTDTWKDLVIAGTDVKEEIFDTVFHICTEVSFEGREGKAVGTTFLIGDSKNVMAKSRQIMLNAFEGHRPESRQITNPDIKENIKEFAQLDGAFVITGDGFIEAAGRYITVDTSTVSLPKGMGTRHNSVAAITAVTGAVGIVVSQSGGGITIFKNGQILKKITL
ncbi:MAG TPA: PAS domain S-box protein [Methanoregula sp.]|nr:PAS domain S-box protein [Methanoregula sp.]